MKVTYLINEQHKIDIHNFMYAPFDVNNSFSKKIKKIILENLNKEKSLLEKNINIVLLIIYNMGNFPFMTQKEILKDSKIKLNEIISHEDLKKVNKILQEVKFIQEIIINFGLGKKYWKNTIIPISNSGSIKNTLEKKYNYPFRVGLYPGLSCMFECVFCGRNYNAKYERSALDLGIEKYIKLIKEAPKDDKYRFYISGGLEPLTNPKLGEIILELKNNGFQVPMYTNAFMLSQKYLKKENGLGQLNSIRVSIYGMDDIQYFNTTKKKNSFKIVTQNIINLIKYKEEKNLSFDIGLNYVILENSSSDIIKILENIKKINLDVGNKKNNIQFLTLREDFRCTQSLRMDNNERSKLKTIFHKFDKMLAEEKLLENLLVDFGYSLEPIKNGYKEDKFENIFASKKMLLPEGTPNISVAVDLYGDVYGYREAAFLDRPGSKRYILGRIDNENSFESIIKQALLKKRSFIINESDLDYLDAWDHIVLRTLNQAKEDEAFGISFENGPVFGRTYNKNTKLEDYRTHFSNPKA